MAEYAAGQVVAETVEPQDRRLNGLYLRKTAARAGVAIAALLLAACGSEDDELATSPTSQTTVEVNEDGSTTTEPQSDTTIPGDKEQSPESKYPEHTVTATIFWLGEGATADNADISNAVTEWDPAPVQRFGGVDDLYRRGENGLPEFTPLHNPYYFALPASEFTPDGPISGAREASPWVGEDVGPDESLFKGRWAKVTNPASGDDIYAQWIDTGPCDDPSACQDYEYVFGDSGAAPQNNFGLKAGIDLSPTAAIDLGFSDGGREVVWQFVDEQEVPDGPWRAYPSINNKNYW